MKQTHSFLSVVLGWHLCKILRIYLLKIFLMLDVCSDLAVCVSHLVLWLVDAYSLFL